MKFKGACGLTSGWIPFPVFSKSGLGYSQIQNEWLTYVGGFLAPITVDPEII